MRVVISLCALAIANGALAAPKSSSGGWQYARWGMTIPELEAASGGKVHASTASNAKNWQEVGDYTSGDYQFSSEFSFNEHGLESVDLTLKNPSPDICVKLKFDLLAKYGPHNPDDSMPGAEFLSWQRPDTNSRVIYMGGGTYCGITYQRAQTTSSSGL